MEIIELDIMCRDALKKKVYFIGHKAECRGYGIVFPAESLSGHTDGQQMSCGILLHNSALILTLYIWEHMGKHSI